ncbi:hypothetical protein L1887_48297 [Cichorium endivia]|nr:hypothetical protein L1887_48297 [Cichorium endivia]
MEARCRRPLTILPQEHSECRNACGRAKIADIRECSVGSQSRADRCQLGAAPHRRRARRGGGGGSEGGRFELLAVRFCSGPSLSNARSRGCAGHLASVGRGWFEFSRCAPAAGAVAAAGRNFVFFCFRPPIFSPARPLCASVWPALAIARFRSAGRTEEGRGRANHSSPWPSTPGPHPRDPLEKYLPSAHPFLLTFTYLPPLFRSTGKHASSHGRAPPAWHLGVTHALRCPLQSLRILRLRRRRRDQEHTNCPTLPSADRARNVVGPLLRCELGMPCAMSSASSSAGCSCTLTIVAVALGCRCLVWFSVYLVYTQQYFLIAAG